MQEQTQLRWESGRALVAVRKSSVRFWSRGSTGADRMAVAHSAVAWELVVRDTAQVQQSSKDQTGCYNIGLW